MPPSHPTGVHGERFWAWQMAAGLQSYASMSWMFENTSVLIIPRKELTSPCLGLMFAHSFNRIFSNCVLSISKALQLCSETGFPDEQWHELHGRLTLIFHEWFMCFHPGTAASDNGRHGAVRKGERTSFLWAGKIKHLIHYSVWPDRQFVHWCRTGMCQRLFCYYTLAAAAHNVFWGRALLLATCICSFEKYTVILPSTHAWNLN